ncbi:helix-turn-helix domain-containing protein [Amycolatopsis cihanbeyliensis]|uniref:Helix-turn-helix protein n=1 Tax=Amycolatopsis cihanbeyliensis TaxID=1128664 RepID=A0A542DQE9_AMYCI|nr:hypothetical protein [Amycolatopsis cihanbeyliensis]TQJ05322.1 hypothetical protein FB471_5150 [Amycolatopsis cihanbeyliensis]
MPRSTSSADQGPAEILRQENFAEALRAAIHRRGLTLERIQSRLAARGMKLSLATLSYWQQGRSRPERRTSLHALREIETILELPPSTLLDFLTQSRPCGRRPHGEDAPPRTALPERANTGISVLSVSDFCSVDAERNLRMISTTQVVRSVDEPQDRILLVHAVDDGDSMPTDIRVRIGRLGAVRVDHEAGYLAAEILFGRTLVRNSTTVIEYDTVLDTGTVPSRRYERRLRDSLHSCLIRVGFDAAARPTRCYAYYRPTAPDGPGERTRLCTDDSLTVHTFAPDAAPGVYGISWRWG